jgi:hypothetical protein
MAKDRDTAVEILAWIQTCRPDLIPKDAEIRTATDEEDQHHATDAVIVFKSGVETQVGFRTSSEKGSKRFKIRFESEGYQTELEKIRSGDCNWYLCAWHDEKGTYSFALLDIDAMRKAGDFENEAVNGNGKWRFQRWDAQTSYIYRYMTSVEQDGYVLFEQTKPDVDASL